MFKIFKKQIFFRPFSASYAKILPLRPIFQLFWQKFLPPGNSALYDRWTGPDAPNRGGTIWTGDLKFKCKEVKLDFAERDKCRPVLLRLPLDRREFWKKTLIWLNGGSVAMDTERWFCYRWVIKSGLNGIYLPNQLTDWQLLVVALLPIGLTQISLTKSGFNHPSVREITSLAAASGSEPGL